MTIADFILQVQGKDEETGLFVDLHSTVVEIWVATKPDNHPHAWASLKFIPRSEIENLTEEDVDLIITEAKINHLFDPAIDV